MAEKNDRLEVGSYKQKKYMIQFNQMQWLDVLWMLI